MSTRSFIELLWIRWKTSWWNFKEFLRVSRRFYPVNGYGRKDLYLLRHYLLESPFGISKRYAAQQGYIGDYTYGETPLTTLEKMSKECGVHSRDVVYELGCGRGRSCFWLQHFISCKVFGVEIIPAFIKKAQSVKKRFNTEDVKFLCQDMLEVDLTKATVIYYYGTCAEDEFIRRLSKKFEKLSPKTKIITVSFPLTDYSDAFKIVKRFKGQFPWGETDVFLQVKIS